MAKRKRSLLARARARLDLKAKPHWHSEICCECGMPFEEYSDPRASLCLCEQCFDQRTRGRAGAAPLQRRTYADVWWEHYVFEYEQARRNGQIDQWGRTLEIQRDDAGSS